MTKGDYIWIMKNFIKETYEQWGIDIMSFWDEIQREFPNAAEAVRRMYVSFDEISYYKAELKKFENPEYVYEAVANLIPARSILSFDIKTTAHFLKYEDLRVYGWNEMKQINRIDLIMALMLFAEEFALMSLADEKVIFTSEKLIVQTEFVTFKVVKHKKRTIASINIHGVILLEYIIDR